MTPRSKPDPFEELVRQLASGSVAPAADEKKLRDALTQGQEEGRVEPSIKPAHPKPLLPEIMLGRGKTPVEALSIFRSMLEKSCRAIATRLSTEAFELVLKEIPDCRSCSSCTAISAGTPPSAQEGSGAPFVALVTAGTSDLRVASETEFILGEMSVSCRMYADVGSAGIHRLVSSMEEIGRAAVCIVYAGMDGVLPSVLGGLYGGPVIAVPTSEGYGTSFGGVSALLTMLNSSAPGIAVMNVDNGLGAAAAALRILGTAGGAPVE